MDRELWLIPVSPAPGLLLATLRVLEGRDIPHAVVDPHRVRERLEADAPLAAIVQGGTLSPLLFDTQRWLADFAVPTLVMVEGLSDHYEAVLLDRGAADVLAVPASAPRLRSRLEALARRRQTATAPPPPVEVHFADVTILPRRRTVEVDATTLPFTRSEFDLLLALALRPGEVLTRNELATACGKHLSGRALESHISRIRLKLRRAGVPDCIDSVRAVGYRLLVPG